MKRDSRGRSVKRTPPARAGVTKTPKSKKPLRAASARRRGATPLPRRRGKPPVGRVGSARRVSGATHGKIGPVGSKLPGKGPGKKRVEKRVKVLKGRNPNQRVTPTGRVIIPLGRPVKEPATLVITSFHAKGEIGTGFSYTGQLSRESESRRYRNRARTRPPGLISGPGAFHSNEFIPVNFPGKVPLEKLMNLLNEALNLQDKHGNQKDFRKVYRVWTYKYQVFQKTNAKYYQGKLRTKVARRVVERKNGRSRSR